MSPCRRMDKAEGLLAANCARSGPSCAAASVESTALFGTAEEAKQISSEKDMECSG